MNECYWFGNNFLKRTEYCMSQGKVAAWIPGVVFAAVAIVTGLLALLLPETLNRPLPETIKEVESWTRSIIPPPATEHRPTAPRPFHGRSSPIPEFVGDEDDEEKTSKLWCWSATPTWIARKGLNNNRSVFIYGRCQAQRGRSRTE